MDLQGAVLTCESLAMVRVLLILVIGIFNSIKVYKFEAKVGNYRKYYAVIIIR